MTGLRHPALKVRTQSSDGKIEMQTYQAEGWTLEIISYWSADKLSSHIFITLHLTTENCTLQIQRKSHVLFVYKLLEHVLEFPRIPSSHVPASLHPESSVPESPRPRVPRPRVPASHVLASPRPRVTASRRQQRNVPSPTT